MRREVGERAVVSLWRMESVTGVCDIVVAAVVRRREEVRREVTWDERMRGRFDGFARDLVRWRCSGSANVCSWSVLLRVGHGHELYIR